MRKAKILALNAVILTAASLLTNTAGMSFNVYISNKIGAEAMGVFQLIMSVYMFAITLAISGIGLASTRLVAEELAFNRGEGAKRAVTKCLIHAVSFGAFSAVILALSADFIANNWLHSKLTLRPLYALSISLPFISMSSVMHGYFTAVQRVVKSASAQIFEQFIRIFVTIYILNLLLPKGLEAACFAIVLGGTVSEVSAFLYILLMYSRDKKRYKCSSVTDNRLTRRMLNISLPVAFSSYIRSGLATFRQIITPLSLEKSGVSCTDALAKYGIIRGMVFPVLMFPSSFLNAFSSLLVPEIAGCHIMKNHSKINFIISHIFKITLVFSIGVSGIIFAFSSELGTAIYKSNEASLYLKLLSPLIPIIYFDNIVDGLLKGINEQLSVVRINIIDTIMTIALTYSLLPAYGINGYIAVIFISEIINAYLSIRRLYKTTHFSVNFFSWIAKPLFAVFVSTAVTKLLIPFNLILNIALTAVIYLAALYALGCVTKEDFSFLKNKS